MVLGRCDTTASALNVGIRSFGRRSGSFVIDRLIAVESCAPETQPQIVTEMLTRPETPEALKPSTS